MIVVKNGQFYDTVSMKIVRAKIGDVEQIKALQTALTNAEALKGDGLEIEPVFKIEAEISFKCICGHDVEKDFELDDNDTDELNGEEFRCVSCGREYSIKSPRHSCHVLITSNEFE
jgi:hypothetical protein